MSGNLEERQKFHIVTISDLVEITQLPKSWWYARTRERGPDAVPRLKCGKYLRFSLPEVMDWLKHHGRQDQ